MNMNNMGGARKSRKVAKAIARAVARVARAIAIKRIVAVLENSIPKYKWLLI
jgi:hypothetical protein